LVVGFLHGSPRERLQGLLLKTAAIVDYYDYTYSKFAAFEHFVGVDANSRQHGAIAIGFQIWLASTLTVALTSYWAAIVARPSNSDSKSSKAQA